MAESLHVHSSIWWNSFPLIVPAEKEVSKVAERDIVKEAETEISNVAENSDLSAVRVKDFRGVPCPMNFVKTKIELSTLKSGELLEIWLDDGQPIQNVPGSVRKEGHEIKSVVQDGDHWVVRIKKAY